jgi:hypothetical protein
MPALIIRVPAFPVQEGTGNWETTKQITHNTTRGHEDTMTPRFLAHKFGVTATDTRDQGHKIKQDQDAASTTPLEHRYAQSPLGCGQSPESYEPRLLSEEQGAMRQLDQKPLVQYSSSAISSEFNGRPFER